MNSALPKVSIIIPVYNGSKYMREAIDSALSQTYRNIEIIVVNDGSNDNEKTDKIALSYGNKIKYYKKENGGVSTALNFAISKMTGEYFSWLSHDDVYYPEKIEKQITFLENENDNVIPYSDYDLIDKNSKLIGQAIKNHRMLELKPEYALLRGSINGLTLLIPKTAFDEYGLFDENLRCAQDYEMWQRFTKTYIYKHMPEVLVQTRIHGEQVTVTNSKVETEGNKIWINLIESQSKETKEKLENSEYKYYREMENFLKDTPYKQAEEFCKTHAEDLKEKFMQSLKLENIKVSVIIPFFNRIESSINSIESAYNGTHKNIELVLINDGSTDDLAELDTLIKDYNIKLCGYEKNEGVSYARNIGIDNATGDYIAFLDSDDTFTPNKIEKQLTEMLLNNMDVSHTSYLRKGSNNEVIVNSGKLTGCAIPDIIRSCGIATPTVMIKRDLLNDKKYRFDTALTIGEDTCFWLELLRNNEILGIDEALTIVNVSESSAAYNDDKQILGVKTILNYVLNDKEYSKYDYQISLLCMYYSNIVNNKFSIHDANYCPECERYLNSRSWRITKPLRMASAVLRSIKYDGIISTVKKVFKKIMRKENK